MTDISLAEIITLAESFLGWLIFTVVLKYMTVHGAASIIRWVVKRFWAWFKRRILITEEDIRLYREYRNNALYKR